MSTDSTTATPMIAQFLEIKADHHDALLFYRMGDFYEMFFDDAVAAAEALDIALTKRGKHNGMDIPMCGVPAHSAENYLLTLIRKGFRVAVCEQLESPADAKKRGSKSVVKRGVVRLVTPGTLTEESLLDARSHNYLAAYCEIREESALAWVDISTGALRVSLCPRVKLSPELARLRPAELLVQDRLSGDLTSLASDAGAALTCLEARSFDSVSADKRLQDLFAVSSLDAYGSFSRCEISALGALLDYLHATQKDNLPLLMPPAREDTSSIMQIDAATRRNLELTRTLAGSRRGSLLSTIDRTVTSGGARQLEQFLGSPLTKLRQITQRHDSISCFVSNPAQTNDLRDKLRSAPDIERAVSRLSLGRGGPRDIASVRAGIETACALHETLAPDCRDILQDIVSDLNDDAALVEMLGQALVPDPPLLLRDGGFVANGYNEDLDDARRMRDDGRQVIARLQSDYAAQCGIQNLKIKHNNVLGYFIETTAAHAEKMLAQPLSDTFIHRQTTASAIRFTTVELAGLETKILNAGQRTLALEAEIFEALRIAVLNNAMQLNRIANAIATIDVYTALADLALAEKWVRPQVDDSRAFKIDGGRHPVVEIALRTQAAGVFVANACNLSANDSAGHICLLTGPNMAGKSTYLRQNALIAILAQMGSYVPAVSAHIGLVSQLFSRVGASDDLARGRSTFMVEMVETAAILNQSDNRALVILDEIGRGTSTYDGLSIAWATLEYLHDVNKCRALFATHYHELTALALKLDAVENATVAVREWEGDVIFLHEVREGAADRSYGVQVAKLAGLPIDVVERARSILDILEKGERDGGASPTHLIDDLPLFSVPHRQEPEKQVASQLDLRINQINPDDLSPRDALSLLYELKALTGG